MRGTSCAYGEQGVTEHNVLSWLMHIGKIVLRIGIQMEVVCMHCFDGTRKRRDGFLPQTWRAPIGCPLRKFPPVKTLS